MDYFNRRENWLERHDKIVAAVCIVVVLSVGIALILIDGGVGAQ